ncbi:MAG: hypothetical protein ABH832_02555 [bacterium]
MKNNCGDEFNGGDIKADDYSDYDVNDVGNEEDENKKEAILEIEQGLNDDDELEDLYDPDNRDKRGPKHKKAQVGGQTRAGFAKRFKTNKEFDRTPADRRAKVRIIDKTKKV